MEALLKRIFFKDEMQYMIDSIYKKKSQFSSHLLNTASIKLVNFISLPPSLPLSIIALYNIYTPTLDRKGY